MALSESIKQIATFYRCIQHLFFHTLVQIGLKQKKKKGLFVGLPKKGEHAMSHEKIFQGNIILKQIMSDLWIAG